MWAPAAHYIIPWDVVYAKCTNGVCIVVRLTVALERTLVTVKYKEKRKSQCTALHKILLFCVEIIVVAHCARPAEERRKFNFRHMLTCSSRKQCSFYFWSLIYSVSVVMHVWNFKTDVSVSCGAHAFHMFVLAPHFLFTPSLHRVLPYSMIMK